MTRSLRDLDFAVQNLERGGKVGGTSGQSDYQKAVEAGLFVGTETDWFAAILNPPGGLRIVERTFGDGINRILLVDHGMGVLEPEIELRRASVVVDGTNPIVVIKADYAPVDENSGNFIFNPLNPIPAANSITARFTASV